MRKLIAMATLSIMLIAGSAMAQVTQEVRATWTPPTVGNPVVEYVFQLSTDGGPFIDYAVTEQTTLLVDLEILKTYVARVAGVDANGGQGPWSEDSDPYIPDLGLPGAPGKPLVVESTN